MSTPDVAAHAEEAPNTATVPTLEQLASQATKSYRSLGDTVHEVLHQAVVSGVLEPGSKVSQTELAKSLGVSRIPVRAALVQLESEGLVEFQPRRGVRVRSLSVDEIRESYELRTVLESHALRSSMASMTPERLRRLRALADELDETTEGPAFLERREAYYHELYDVEHYPMRGKLIDELRNVVGASLLRKRIASHAHRPHRALQDAIEAGDVDHAVGVLQKHLAGVRDAAVKALSDTSPHANTTRKNRPARIN